MKDSFIAQGVRMIFFSFCFLFIENVPLNTSNCCNKQLKEMFGIPSTFFFFTFWFSHIFPPINFSLLASMQWLFWGWTKYKIIVIKKYWGQMTTSNDFFLKKENKNQTNWYKKQRDKEQMFVFFLFQKTSYFWYYSRFESGTFNAWCVPWFILKKIALHTKSVVCTRLSLKTTLTKMMEHGNGGEFVPQSVGEMTKA